MKKDPTFRKVMDTWQDLKENERLETAELATDKRKFLLDRSCVKQTVSEDWTISVHAFLQETKAIERTREKGSGFVGFHTMTCYHIVTFSKVISE